MIAMEVQNKRLKQKAKKFEENVYKTLPMDLRLAGKRTAFYYMEYTLPVSTKANQWPMKKFGERIRENVMHSYPTKSDERWQSSAYDLIKENYSEERAKRWWNTYRSQSQSSFNPDEPGKMDYEVQFDSMRKIPRKTNLSLYSAVLKKNQVQSDRPRLAIPSDSRRQAFIKDRQATMGLAKAGWYASDSSLGGQKNYTKAKAQEGQFVWPTQLRKLMSRFGKGIGSGFVSASGSYGRFEITNHVRYIWEALPDHLKEAAEKQSRNAMRIIFELRYKNRKNLNLMMK
jgi:hypothetical protein